MELDRARKIKIERKVVSVIEKIGFKAKGIIRDRVSIHSMKGNSPERDENL